MLFIDIHQKGQVIFTVWVVYRSTGLNMLASHAARYWYIVLVQAILKIALIVKHWTSRSNPRARGNPQWNYLGQYNCRWSWQEQPFLDISTLAVIWDILTEKLELNRIEKLKKFVLFLMKSKIYSVSNLHNLEKIAWVTNFKAMIFLSLEFWTQKTQSWIF